MNHDRVVTVAVDDPNLEQGPAGGGADHHYHIVVIGCRAIHLVANCDRRSVPHHVRVVSERLAAVER
jgi:hypothetical protein